MIRPVLNVDLPGMVRALDDHMRARHGEFADFVVAPDFEEPPSGVAALLSALLPITPNALTWICEDHWRLLGLAQARRRPGAQAWDLAYLAAIGAAGAQVPVAHPGDVLMELVQYALNAAIKSSVHRFFARVEEERAEIELFTRLGFQRYALELSYWLPSPAAGLAALDRSHPVALADPTAPADPAEPRSPADPAFAPPAALETVFARRLVALGDKHHGPAAIRPDVPLRPWHRHDAWGLLRLYDACTPKRVQLAEALTSEELVHTRAAGGRTWHVPLVEPAAGAYVHDHGVRLGGWVRLRFGRGAMPHAVSLMAHPDDPDTAPALLRTALRVFAQEPERPVLCQVRDYETAVVGALRDAGFEHTTTHALLVRHLTARAFRRREIAATDSRLVYGVKGLGTVPSHLSEGEKAHYARENP